ncbi:MAG: nuclear transport factor 2 family protein [Gammaproteobacteria bacterium]|nr:nuclear transport factor 2 family protein [Gammaproteobacteria bacterium]
MSDADKNLEIGERYMQAVSSCDVDAVREIYAPDARIWHNFDQALQSVEDNIKTLEWIHGKLSDLEYDIVRREPIPGGFYQQHVLRGKLATGADFAMPACAIVKIENGRIASLDEYLDTAHTQPLSKAG